MKSKLVLIVIFLLALTIIGCTANPSAPQQAPPEEANARNNLDWAGVYQGIVPSAAGMGIKVQLVLQADGSYQLTYEYLTDGAQLPEVGSFDWNRLGANIFEESGNFEWDDTGNVIKLDVANWPPYYRVGEGMLTQLDMSGNLITGELADNYILTKVATPS